MIIVSRCQTFSFKLILLVLLLLANYLGTLTNFFDSGEPSTNSRLCHYKTPTTHPKPTWIGFQVPVYEGRKLLQTSLGFFRVSVRWSRYFVAEQQYERQNAWKI
ncbi:hypothetical protein DFH05DRAFT_260429 [Lentinula detonsa]|uniref:Uncharacterized protein n=1 Tax=Lentinula detonsa TaxID=2804962 RepID=A0A9W8NVY9_9AGAR|nr:hypothetical protein DFH05DRAFT_260429 [Lentinula detonsa]